MLQLALRWEELNHEYKAEWCVRKGTAAGDPRELPQLTESQRQHEGPPALPHRFSGRTDIAA